MTDDKRSLADLIAATPGAQTREEAKRSIKARRAKLMETVAPPPEDLASPEVIPLIDNPDAFAREFFQRLQDKEKPKRGSKPRLIVDNGGDDDEPEPPKAA